MPTFDLGFAPSRHCSPRPGFDGTSLQDFFAAFPNDEACLAHVFERRFGSNPLCPRCGRSGRWRRHDVQKHYFHPCGGILSPMTGVVFHRTKIPLQLWFYAMLHLANSAEGIASSFLARQLGVSEPTAFRMGHKIRLHLAALEAPHMLGSDGGPVLAQLARVRRICNPHRFARNTGTVFLLSDGIRVDASILEATTQRNIRRIVERMTHRDCRIITDCFWTYRVMANYSSGKPIAEYDPCYFVDREPGENINHGFLQYLHLSFADQFRGVSAEKAWLYLKEYQFRYNRRHRSRSTFWDMVERFPLLDKECLAGLKLVKLLGSAGDQGRNGKP